MKVNITVSLDKSDYPRGSNVTHYARCLECRRAFIESIEYSIVVAVSDPRTREMVGNAANAGARSAELTAFTGSIDEYELIANNIHLRKHGRCSLRKG